MIFRNKEKVIFDAVRARHKEFSIISALDDDPMVPSPRLIEIALAAAHAASALTLTVLDGRPDGEERWYRQWPGEHYKLLAGLVATIKPKTVIEIGTYTGMGTLALKECLADDARLATFDLLPWTHFSQTWLRQEDFDDGRITQHTSNIAEPGVIERYHDLFSAAELIFIDAPKDGITEYKFVDALRRLKLDHEPVIVFDDIRVMNMIAFWRSLDCPKLDLTSFGHWSGTGLVDWTRNR
jgi:predicted O-methyltransferase YrrM